MTSAAKLARKGRRGGSERWLFGRRRWLLVATMALTSFGALAVSAQDIAVPPPPDDPAAAKAYAVIDGACASCHQVGKLKGLARPAGNLGNILDLEALARAPSRIQPGNPDASPLYQSVHGRTMPPEGGETAAPELTAADLTTLRDWIEQLPQKSGCGERPLITPAQLGEAINVALARLPASRAATTRFLSLAQLHNACAPPAELTSASAALIVLINSLSLGLDPVKLPRSGPGDVLLEIDLAAIGWSAERWERLVGRFPAAGFVPISAAAQKAFGSRLPLADAGWFADEATQAQVYYDLIGMPTTLNALLASLRIDGVSEKRDAVDRIGLKTSTVARGNRLIERRPFANGAAWLSREFAPTAGRPDLFDQAIAAANSNRPIAQLQADATVVHFDLPNGFPAFFIANGAGHRLPELPSSILKDDSLPGHKVMAAQSCIACHGTSPALLGRGRADDLRARVQGEAALTKEVRDKLLSTHTEPAEWQRRLDQDKARRDKALAAAGLQQMPQADGLDALPALIAHYQRPVSLDAIAHLTGVAGQKIVEAGKTGSSALADVALRLAFGTVPRRAVDAVLPELARRLGLPVPSGPSTSSNTGPNTGSGNSAAGALLETTEPQLVLKAERQIYQTGDLLALTVRSNFNCQLTLLTLDRKGRATVLYPNEFAPDPQLEAGREVRFPPERSAYQFRLTEKGQETLIAVCAQGGRTVDGIRHDYEKQRFTELGNYRAFLMRTWPNRDGDGKKPRPASSAKPEAPAKPDAQARTAIRITIE